MPMANLIEEARLEIGNKIISYYKHCKNCNEFYNTIEDSKCYCCGFDNK